MAASTVSFVNRYPLKSELAWLKTERSLQEFFCEQLSQRLQETGLAFTNTLIDHSPAAMLPNKRAY